MHAPVEHLALDYRAAADAGADRQVDEGVQSLGGAPAVLTEGGGVDVGVESDWQAEGVSQRADEVGVRPAGFGRGGDEAVFG